MRARAFLVSAVLQLTLAAPVLADAPPPAVWYRASEPCPAGARKPTRAPSRGRNPPRASRSRPMPSRLRIGNLNPLPRRPQLQLPCGHPRATWRPRFPVRKDPTRAWSLGFEAGPMIGISTQPQPRAQVFADFRPATLRLLPDLSLRGVGVGMWGASHTPIGAVRRWILAGRVEGVVSNSGPSSDRFARAKATGRRHQPPSDRHYGQSVLERRTLDLQAAATLA